MRYNKMSDEETKGEWKGSLITLTTIIVAGGVAFIVYKYREMIPSGFFDIPGGMVTFVANVMPFALLVYGFSGDMVNQEFRLSIPSIAALSSVFIFGIIGQFLATKSGTDLSPQDSSGRLWCSIPGLESAESPYFPTAIMTTCIISLYYICWAWHTNSSSTLALFFYFSGILTVQLATFVFGECFGSYTAPYNSPVLVILIPIFLGSIIGIITFASSRGSQNPFNIPLASPSAAAGTAGTSAGGCPPGTTSAGQYRCTSDSGGPPVCENGFFMNNGNCIRLLTNGGHSQQVQGGGDENTFVAELYKNGQLVTDSISS